MEACNGIFGLFQDVSLSEEEIGKEQKQGSTDVMLVRC